MDITFRYKLMVVNELDPTLIADRELVIVDKTGIGMILVKEDTIKRFEIHDPESVDKVRLLLRIMDKKNWFPRLKIGAPTNVRSIEKSSEESKIHPGYLFIDKSEPSRIMLYHKRGASHIGSLQIPILKANESFLSDKFQLNGVEYTVKEGKYVHLQSGQLTYNEKVNLDNRRLFVEFQNANKMRVRSATIVTLNTIKLKYRTGFIDLYVGNEYKQTLTEVDYAKKLRLVDGSTVQLTLGNKLDNPILKVTYTGNKKSSHPKDRNELTNDFVGKKETSYSFVDGIYHSRSSTTDYQNMIFTCLMYVSKPETVNFGIDGDDAVDYYVINLEDPTLYVQNGYYGGHGFRGSPQAITTMTLRKGWYLVHVRQEEDYGAEGVVFYWKYQNESEWKVFGTGNKTIEADFGRSTKTYTLSSPGILYRLPKEVYQDQDRFNNEKFIEHAYIDVDNPIMLQDARKHAIHLECKDSTITITAGLNTIDIQDIQNFNFKECQLSFGDSNKTVDLNYYIVALRPLRGDKK